MLLKLRFAKLKHRVIKLQMALCGFSSLSFNKNIFNL